MPRRLYICFLGLLAASPPLATDMYLPAIPSITQQWQVETSQLHLSLVLWFVAYSLTLMVWGSLSDRYGIVLATAIQFASAELKWLGYLRGFPKPNLETPKVSCYESQRSTPV